MSQFRSPLSGIQIAFYQCSKAAEKSHQKARKDGFVECWTMIRVADLDLALARRESPSTDRFYNIDAITEADSEELADFRENLCARVGISDQ